MEDLTGKELGLYKIHNLIGKGGMAVVYKAYQSAMSRYVAIKILPRESIQDEHVGRFKHETRLIANLEHTHILPVYDSGEAEGYLYIVMRLVETGTLADQLQGRPLPLPQIRRVMLHVGDALDYAHKDGIIHRDIKPSNILKDQNDNYLLADFGIAKTEGTGQAETKYTQTGAVLGTPSYMSPEQGLDEPLDYRSDIYSLGVVLYQMATGQLPYTADTSIKLMLKHIQGSPPLPRELNPELSPAVEQVIIKAMSRQREDRFSSLAELNQALGRAIDIGAPAAAHTVVESALHSPTAAPPHPHASLDVTPLNLSPMASTTSGLGGWTLVGIAGGVVSLVVLGVVVAVAGFFLWNYLSNPTATPATPFPTSPTTQVIETATATDGRTSDTPISASTSTPESIIVATKSPINGLIAFDSSRDGDTEIYVMNPDGTNATRLTFHSGIDDEPDMSPDGQWITYESKDGTTWSIIVMRIDGSSPRLIASGTSREPDWSPDGRSVAYEAIGSNGKLQIWVVDASGGEGRQLTNDVYDNRAPSWSPDGSELVMMSNINGTWQLVILDVGTGRQTQITGGSDDKRFPVWSPNGNLISYNTLVDDQVGQVWTIEPSGSNAAQLTFSGQNGRPAWSPDSQYLLFNSDRDGAWLIYRMNRDGSDQGRLTSIGDDQRPSWGAR